MKTNILCNIIAMCHVHLSHLAGAKYISIHNKRFNSSSQMLTVVEKELLHNYMHNNSRFSICGKKQTVR